MSGEVVTFLNAAGAPIPVTLANPLPVTGGGGGGGGTSSAFAAAFPATGTAIGYHNAGGNMDYASVDASHNQLVSIAAQLSNLNVNIAAQSLGSVIVTGNVASGATDSGNPVSVAGVAQTTLPTFLAGQRGALQLTTRGLLAVQLFGGNAAIGSNFVSSDGVSTATLSQASQTFNYVYNGASWDRVISSLVQCNTGATTGVPVSEEGGRQYAHLTASGAVKSGPGNLHTLNISCTLAGNFTLFDNTVGSGTVISIITMTNGQVVSMMFDLHFNTALFFNVNAGTFDAVFAFR